MEFLKDSLRLVFKLIAGVVLLFGLVVVVNGIVQVIN